MINFSVGYQFCKDSRWIDSIIHFRERIHEVFFSIVGVPNGRTGIPLFAGKFSLEEQKEKLHLDLTKLNDAGLKFNILYNASCYGKDGQSSVFFDNVVKEVEYYRTHFNLESVTTTSPFIAEVIKRNFPTLLTRASINMGISSILAMDYVSNVFDGFYLKQEHNRNISLIRKVKKWCDENGKQLFMLANSGCLNDCAIHFFHNNLAAHSDEISNVDKRYPIRGCRDYLSRPGKMFSIVRDGNWIRPEDLHLYDGLFTSVKLATRINKCPEKILEAYINGHYSGSIMDLMEPDHSYVMTGKILDNNLFPQDFGEHTGFCSKNCDACSYCKTVFEQAIKTK